MTHHIKKTAYAKHQDWMHRKANWEYLTPIVKYKCLKAQFCWDFETDFKKVGSSLPFPVLVRPPVKVDAASVGACTSLLNVPSHLSGADSPAFTMHCIYKDSGLSSRHRDMEAHVKISAMKCSKQNKGKWESGSMLIVNFLVDCLSCKILLYF